MQPRQDPLVVHHFAGFASLATAAAFVFISCIDSSVPVVRSPPIPNPPAPPMELYSLTPFAGPLTEGLMTKRLAEKHHINVTGGIYNNDRPRCRVSPGDDAHGVNYNTDSAAIRTGERIRPPSSGNGSAAVPAKNCSTTKPTKKSAPLTVSNVPFPEVSAASDGEEEDDYSSNLTLQQVDLSAGDTNGTTNLSTILSGANGEPAAQANPNVSELGGEVKNERFGTAGCGRNKGCLFKPPDCVPYVNCSYALGYSASADRRFLFIELFAGASFCGTGSSTSAVGTGSDCWVAIGQSEDGMMGDDTVTDCSAFGGTGQFLGRLSYNPGKSNRRVPIDEATHSKMLDTRLAVFSDGNLYCRIVQTVDPVAGLSQRYVRSFGTPSYILMAGGRTILRGDDISSADNKNLAIHSLDRSSGKFPFVSEGPISLLQFSAKNKNEQSGEQQAQQQTEEVQQNAQITPQQNSSNHDVAQTKANDENLQQGIKTQTQRTADVLNDYPASIIPTPIIMATFQQAAPSTFGAAVANANVVQPYENTDSGQQTNVSVSNNNNNNNNNGSAIMRDNGNGTALIKGGVANSQQQQQIKGQEQTKTTPATQTETKQQTQTQTIFIKLHGDNDKYQWPDVLATSFAPMQHRKTNGH